MGKINQNKEVMKYLHLFNDFLRIIRKKESLGFKTAMSIQDSICEERKHFKVKIWYSTFK